ncbi:hypothetical protein C8J56DRAFT_193781 [Mycena floridula]|nr:hypothetical protein C8J56DRAFT_193781 [Mycena floridula]
MLPQELIELIVDECQHDRRSLAAFALVSRGWLAASRRKLFRCITLEPRNYEGFQTVLNSSFCTFLDVVERIIFDSISTPPPEDFLPTNSLTVVNCVGIARAQLDNLRLPYFIPIDSIEEIALSRVTVAQPGVLSGFLSRFPRLQRLHLDVTPLDLAFSGHSLPRQVESLYLSSSDWALAWVSSLQPPQPLKHLTVSRLALNDNNMRLLNAVVSSLSSTLLELEVSIIAAESLIYPVVLTETLELSCLSYLQSLHFNDLRVDIGRPILDSVYMRILSSVRPSIVRLSFTMRLKCVIHDDVHFCNWDELLKVLSKPQFSHLQEISFDIRFPKPLKQTAEDLSYTLRTSFPCYCGAIVVKIRQDA